VWWLGNEVGEVLDERKPMLRVVRFLRVRPSAAPVSLDAGYALDVCLSAATAGSKIGTIGRLPPIRDTR
jgi:hypothetical protein